MFPALPVQFGQCLLPAFGGVGMVAAVFAHQPAVTVVFEIIDVFGGGGADQPTVAVVVVDAPYFAAFVPAGAQILQPSQLVAAIFGTYQRGFVFEAV